MLNLDKSPPPFVSRAVGILHGTLVPDLTKGPSSATIRTLDGSEIPTFIPARAAEKLAQNPAVLAQRMDFLVYPRTEKRLLKAILVDFEPASTRSDNPDRDVFLVQGINIGSRVRGVAQLGIRTNRRSDQNFERFWLCLFGHLKEDLKCVYRVKAFRKGRRLYIVESAPQLQNEKCRSSNRAPKARTIITARGR